MPFQYPKQLTVKYAKDKLGSDTDLNGFYTKIGEVNTAVDDLDKDNMEEMDIKGVQTKFKELTAQRNAAKTKLDKRAKSKTGKDKDKQAAAKLIEKLDELSVELDTASKVVNNQLLTLIKENAKRKTWKDIEKSCATDIEMVKRLGQQNTMEVKKATEKLTQIKTDFDALGQKPDDAGPEQKKYLAEKKKLVEQLADLETKAKRMNVTGVVGYAGFEEAAREVRNKMMLVKLSDKDADERDKFFKEMDKTFATAIQRREPILRAFGAVRMLLARE